MKKLFDMLTEETGTGTALIVGFCFMVALFMIGNAISGNAQSVTAQLIKLPNPVCQLHVEVVDTTVVRYKYYECGWETIGFYYTPKICKDSIGVQRQKVNKLFYYLPDGTRYYIDLQIVEYLKAIKGN